MKFTIKEPVFGTLLHVFIQEDFKVFRKHAKKHYNWPKKFVSTPKENNDGRCMYDSDYLYGYLWLPCGIKTPYAIGVLAHEVGHYLVHVMDTIGESVIPNREETYLYLLKFYVSEILKRGKK